ncbi:MAG TPA: hypothetical protein VM144_02315 [Aestuariivirga sp.]|nr:hypothetical protein [Aestuariivirga sp.]
MFSRRNLLKSGFAAAAATTVQPAFSQETVLDDVSLQPGVMNPADVWESNNLPPLEQGEVSISVKDSGVPNALDLYYSFLYEIVGQNGFTEKQKLLVNNTISPLDIAQDTPYYNEGLFRNFADRVFLKSPQSMGPANRADRFSMHYEAIVRIAASKLDRKYRDIVSEIEGLQNRMEAQTEKLANVILKINEQWQRVATGSGIKPEDPTFELRYLNFLESVRYADQVDQYTQNIDMLVSTIDAVRRAKYAPEEQILLDIINQLSKTRKVARPKRATFERTVRDVTELTFANPTIRVESIMDISPAMYPLGDLVRFLQLPGKRSMSISKDMVAAQQHDKSWSAGGSASYKFFKIGGNGSGSSSYREDIKKTAGIAISFENIAEYLVDRELWFNPSIFQHEKLAPVISKIPGVERLEFVAVSVIIARGLTLQLTFDSSVKTESWSKRSFAASGGASFMGFGFSGSGSNSSYDYNLDVSADGKTVTFQDDPQLSRVLAVRLEKLLDIEAARLAVNTDTDMEMAAPNTPLGKFLKGKMSYFDLQNTKFTPPKN